MLVVWEINVLHDVREDDFLERFGQWREECHWVVGGAY